MAVAQRKTQGLGDAMKSKYKDLVEAIRAAEFEELLKWDVDNMHSAQTVLSRVALGLGCRIHIHCQPCSREFRHSPGRLYILKLEQK